VLCASVAVADLKDKILQNPAPYIPPQCYTKTIGPNKTVHNTCYTCHTKGFRPDYTNDNDLQLEYIFPVDVEKNHWTNLFRDRSQQIAAIGDRDILGYVRKSNYFDQNGNIILSRTLASVPKAWDDGDDGRWSGFIPDCYFNFDREGFDRDPVGKATGWRAMAYYPFPSTYWPANGTFSDVLIRLPEAFRTQNGRFDPSIYKLNLAILEAVIKRADVIIEETDEKALGVDLDKDGRLNTASRVVYDWAPTEGRPMHFVGDAGVLQRRGEIHLAAGLYPKGTEFLNTLRYLDVTPQGKIRMAARMKEVRYMKKTRWITYAAHETLAMNEIKEKSDFPDRLKLLVGNIEEGVGNGRGWVLQGFIEDAQGRLRPQTFEETASCVGCHGGIGITTDSTFSMPRKFDASSSQEGWFHWSQKDLQGVPEPKAVFARAGVQYEYCFYLMYANSGDEFRANREIIDTFFDAAGMLRETMAQKIHDDVSILLYPSAQRALALNKAYKVIVDEQGFAAGRDGLIETATNVHEEILPKDIETGVTVPVLLSDFPKNFAWGNGHRSNGGSLSDALALLIDGNEMAGPNGRRYQIDRSGLIDESTYAISKKGVYFPFPARHALPTRMIVPNGAMTTCYECHRLAYPMPPDTPQLEAPVPFPRAESTEKGLGLVQLTTDTAIDTNGVWRPDGKRIAWVSDRSGDFQVWVMNPDGTQKRQISRQPGIHGWPMWSPDGRRLVYWGHDEADGSSVIKISNADGGGETVNLVVSQGALDRPVWRPDGQYIAYAQEIEGNWDIWVAAVDGSASYRLTHDAQMETNPLWSPDGNVIAYKVAPNKEYNLTLENFVSIANGFDRPTYRIWDGIKSIQMNDWSPDGKRIVYTAEAVTSASGVDRVSYLAVINAVSLSGSQTAAKPILLSDGNTLGDRGPVFSPDGKRVAFWAWDKSRRATLWVADATGNNVRQLTTKGFDMYPRWRPDGQTILFESGRSGNLDIWTVSIR
jgi:Tol biopolymer transport system component